VIPDYPFVAFTVWNDRMTEITGYTMEEINHLGWYQTVYPDPRVREQAIERMSRMRQGDDMLFEEWIITRADGEQRALLISTSVLESSDGVAHVLAVMHDITERKRVEEALKTSEQRLALAVEASGAGIYDHAVPLGPEVYHSERWANILGYKLEELPPYNQFLQWLVEQTHPDDLPRLDKAYSDFVEGRSPAYHVEIRMKHKSGEWIYVEGFSQAVNRDENGQATRIVGVTLDITERKQAEEALRQAHQELAAKAAELEAANVELEQYAYVVSHDIRAPLRAIRNYADFIQEDIAETLGELDEKDLKLYLGGLGSAVREAEELVGDLLELSRVGRRGVPIEAVDVGAFLRGLIAILRPPADVEIVMADDWPTIEVEPVLLGQIFQNLIDNAIKFNRSPRKRIALGWRSIGEGHEQQYELFVRDNGIGIDPRYHEQIFRVFERLHTREEYDGTGIGLAIVNKAVNKLGGSVRVASKPGKGSTFFVTLPQK
jgi:PAS domain S-box-containing protein